MTHMYRASFAALTALGLLLASPAVAQTPPPDPHHPAGAPAETPQTTAPQGMMMPMMGNQQGMMGWDHPMMGMMVTHSEGLFAFLEVEIGITEAQTQAWTAYTAQLKPLIKQHQTAMQMMPDPAAKPSTWIERLSDSEAIVSEHLETMKKIRPAATALYAELTPEQKKKADALMPLMPGAVGMKMGARRDAN